MLRLSTLIFIFFAGMLRAEMIVSEAKVRLLPPGVPNTAAYFSIENPSDVDVILVSVEADFAKKAEIHNHFMIDNMMRMQQQSEVIIPAGKTVHFQPSGLHIMLFGLKQALSEGQSLPLTLYTKTGELIHFTAKVTRPGSQAHSHH